MKSPPKWKTLRIFISSTFLDMQAERDHLIRFVFPILREKLFLRRIHLREIDLRWGITSEDNVVSVCKDIIDECQPRMIIMLGERYGSIPENQETSVTSMEIDYGVTKYGRARRRPLLSLLFPQLGRRKTQWKEATQNFFFRDPAATHAIPEPDIENYREPHGSETQEKLASLKQRIQNLGYQPVVYPARWDSTQQRLVDLDTFGQSVLNNILQGVEDEFGPAEPFQGDAFDEENSQIEAFIADTVARYISAGRDHLIDQVVSFAGSRNPQLKNRQILTIIGESGSGKSAFLARCITDANATYPSTLIIPHFAGVGASSADLRNLLRRLCREIGGADPGADLPITDLSVAFASCLQDVAKQRDVTIFIDALNQLDATDAAHELHWLPLQLPERVRVIFSTTDHPVRAALAQREETQVEFLQLPALEDAQARHIVVHVMRQYQKKFTGDQISSLLSKEDAERPLYLLAALEELRTLGKYDEITKRIQSLPDRTESLFVWILRERLAHEPGFSLLANEGNASRLVNRFVSLIGISRLGLSHRELCALIPQPGEEEDIRGDIAALELFLRPYLMNRGDLLDFYHSQFSFAVDHHWLGDASMRQSFHREIATYFESLGYDHPRTASELPYHQLLGQTWSEFRKTIAQLPLQEESASHALEEGILQAITTRLHLDASDPVREAITCLGEQKSHACADLLTDILNRAFHLGGWIVDHVVSTLEPCVHLCSIRNRALGYLNISISIGSSAQQKKGSSDYLAQAEKLSQEPEAADLRPFVLALQATRYPPSKAIAKSQEAVTLAKQLPGSSPQAKRALWQALFNAGRICKHQGQLEEAATLFLQAEQVFSPSVEPILVLWAIEKQIIVAIQQGQLLQAAQLLAQEQQILQFRPTSTLDDKFREQVGWLSLLCGQWDTGFPLLQTANRLHQERNRREYVRSLCKLVNAGIDADRFDDVQHHQEALLETLDSEVNRTKWYYGVWVAQTLGRWATHTGSSEEAKDYLQRARSILQEKAFPSAAETHCFFEAEWAKSSGVPEQAQRLAEQAWNACVRSGKEILKPSIARFLHDLTKEEEWNQRAAEAHSSWKTEETLQSLANLKVSA